jgi:hypothetical protein
METQVLQPFIIVRKSVELSLKKSLTDISKFIEEHNSSIDSFHLESNSTKISDEVIEKLDSMKKALEAEKSYLKDRKSQSKTEKKVREQTFVDLSIEPQSTKKRKRQKNAQ